MDLATQELKRLSEMQQKRSWLTREIVDRYYFYRRLYRIVKRHILWHVVNPIQKLRFPKGAIFITRVTENTDWTAERYCIFVYYEPIGAVSSSVTRILQALKNAGVVTIVVANSPLAYDQRARLAELAGCVLERENVGYDMGGVKDGVALLVEKLSARGHRAQRVVVLNDSVFFLEKGLKEYVDALCGDSDVIYACSNSADPFHLQSFAFSMSGDIFANDAVQGFFRNFIPLEGHGYAVRAGEFSISALLLKLCPHPLVLFTEARLRDSLLKANPDPEFWIYRLGRGLQRRCKTMEKKTGVDQVSSDILIRTVCKTDITLQGAYPLVSALGAPFVKKRIVHFRLYDRDALKILLPEIMTSDEYEDFMASVATPPVGVKKSV